MDSDILVGINDGPKRRAVLDEWFSEQRTESVVERDHVGLTVKWGLPYRGVRRGHAISLNPAFPLAEEVRAVLKIMGKHYGIRPKDDMSPKELGLIKRRHNYDVATMLGSRIRTKILAVMEIFGGKIELSRIKMVVPDEISGSIHGEILRCAENGILASTEIRIPQAPWRRPLRTLMRAHVNLRPEFESRVKDLDRQRKNSLEQHSGWALFGKNPTQRVLMVLAAKGQMTPLRLQTLSTTLDIFKKLERLAAAGIILDTGRRRARRVGLNPAYPVFGELRRCLLLMQGVDRRRYERRRASPLRGPTRPSTSLVQDRVCGCC